MSTCAWGNTAPLALSFHCTCYHQTIRTSSHYHTTLHPPCVSADLYESDAEDGWRLVMAWRLSRFTRQKARTEGSNFKLRGTHLGKSIPQRRRFSITPVQYPPTIPRTSPREGSGPHSTETSTPWRINNFRLWTMPHCSTEHSGVLVIHRIKISRVQNKITNLVGQ